MCCKACCREAVAGTLAWLVAIAIGLGVGVFSGFFIAYLDIPPFVVTLATMLMGRGLTYTLLKSLTVGPLPQDYAFIGTGFLPTIKIDFAGGTLDLVCVGVAAVVTVCLIITELNTIKTNKQIWICQYCSMADGSKRCCDPSDRMVLLYKTGTV